MINEPLILEGRAVRLEPLLPSHHDDLIRAAADGELWRSTVTVVPSSETMAAYIERALREKAGGRQFPFVIVHKPTGRVVGSTRYMSIEASHRRLEIGTTWLARSFQRTVVNTEAKYLLLQHAFEVLRCIRVEFLTDVLNEQSRTAIARLGARQDGVLRNHMIMPDGRYRDSACYSIIESEWPSVRQRLMERLAPVSARAQAGRR